MPIRPQKQKQKPAAIKRYATPFELFELYGIGTEKLRKLRMRGTGPEFRKAGYRTVLYDLQKFEAWLAELPRGGGR